MNTILNRSITVFGINASGQTLYQGDVVILSSGTNTQSSFVLPIATGIIDYTIGVVVDLTIDNNNYGMFIVDGYIPKINLTTSGNPNQYVNTNGNSKLGTPKAYREQGSFAKILTNGTTPQAIFSSITNEIGAIPRAWVVFDGSTGGVATIKSSYGISSVTRTGTGAYSINFKNQMPDTNYLALVSNVRDNGAVNILAGISSSNIKSRARYDIVTFRRDTGVQIDSTEISVVFYSL